nr:MAG TPA: hypothetical protein [Caudoviricetes sp.]
MKTGSRQFREAVIGPSPFGLIVLSHGLCG